MVERILSRVFSRTGFLSLLLVFSAILVFAPLTQTGYTTRDDMGNAINSYQTYVTLAQQQGRVQFMLLHGLLAMGIHQMGDHQTIKIIHVLIMFLCMVTAGLILRRLLGHSIWAWLFVFFYILGLKDNWEHVIYTSSPVLYTLPMLFFLISLLLFHKGLEPFKGSWLWVSAVCYFLSIQISEMFFVLGFAFPVIYWFQARSFKAMGRSLWRHGVLFAAFFIVYISYRLSHPTGYDGNAIEGSWKVLGKLIRTDFIYSLSLFPISNIPDIHNNDFFRNFSGSADQGFKWWVYPFSIFQGLKVIFSQKIFWTSSLLGLLFVAASVPWIIWQHGKNSWPSFQKIDKKGVGALLILFLIMTFGPNFPHALTPKYREWALVHNQTMYVGSYFSYFGMIALMVTGLFCLVQFLSEKKRESRLLPLGISLIFVLAVLIAQPISSVVAKSKIYSHARWSSLDQFMKTDYFKKIPPNSALYMHGFDERPVGNASAAPGYWETYIQWRTGKKLEVSTDASSVRNWGKAKTHPEIYWLSLRLAENRPEGILLFFKTAKTFFGISDSARADATAEEAEIFLVGNDPQYVLRKDLSRCIGRLDPKNAHFTARLNGVRASQIYGTPVPWESDGTGIMGGLPSIIQVNLVNGFYSTETDNASQMWNNAGQKATINIRNNGNREVQVRVLGTLVKGFCGNGRLQISGPKISRSFEVSEKGNFWQESILAMPGDNFISIASGAEMPAAKKGDSREIFFALWNFEAGAEL